MLLGGVDALTVGAGGAVCLQATPLYLSEMAPFKLRGALNIMFQVRGLLQTLFFIWNLKRSGAFLAAAACGQVLTACKGLRLDADTQL